MTSHRYDQSALNGDYARGGFGLALTLLPLLLIGVHPVVFWGLGAAALLFAVFLARTYQRQQTVIELDSNGIASHAPMADRRIAWTDLGQLNLRYFSTRRDRKGGWMHLTLRDGGGTAMKIESNLIGFDTLVDQAAEAAFARRLTLSDATLENLLSLGVTVPSDWSNDAAADNAATSGGGNA
ncbi:MAG: hypothetical protein AAF414_19795 [Pseudomonadota bacterium]